MQKTAIFLSGESGPDENWATVCKQGAQFLKKKGWLAKHVLSANPQLYHGRHRRPGDARPCAGSLQHHVDCALLSVHSSHGEIDRIFAGNVGSETIFISEISPKCHYFWLFSCLVMAHGRSPYDQPFIPGNENVFVRWQHALNQEIRMICGGAGLINVNGGSAVLVLGRILDNGWPLSNSFIVGVSNQGLIGTCLTRGDDKPENTPLCTDKTFVAADNPFTTGNFAFLQYPIWQPANQADAYWSFYSESLSEAAKALVDESPPERIRQASPPPILGLEAIISDDAALDRVRSLVRARLNESLPFASGSTVDVYVSAELGLVNASIHIQNPPEELFEHRAAWRQLIAQITAILGTHLMHFSDSPEPFERGRAGQDDLQMRIDRVPFPPLSNGSVTRYVKDEVARLHPRLFYRRGTRDVSISILSPECYWLMRVTPQDDDDEKKAVRTFEADIVVGGFKIVGTHAIGTGLISPAKAAKRAKRLFAKVNGPDKERYVLDQTSARCGYRLVFWNGGPRFVLVYRFLFHGKEGLQLAGRQVDIPAFDIDDAEFPGLAAAIF